MKINGGKARKRKAEYWLMLSFTWNPSFIVDFKQESRVNDNRKRARLDAAGVCTDVIFADCPDCDVRTGCLFRILAAF